MIEKEADPFSLFRPRSGVFLGNISRLNFQWLMRINILLHWNNKQKLSGGIDGRRIELWQHDMQIALLIVVCWW